MSNKSVTKPLSIAIGAAFITSLAGTSIANAAENPFGMSSLSSGYQVAGKEGKCGEGKCGEGKCGSDKGDKEGKCGEGKCGEGKCGSDKGDKEGKCGEGKCGGSK